MDELGAPIPLSNVLTTEFELLRLAIFIATLFADLFFVVANEAFISTVRKVVNSASKEIAR